MSKDLKDLKFEGPPPDKVEVYKAAIAVLQGTVKLNHMIAHHLQVAEGKPFDDNIGHLCDVHCANLMFGGELFRTIIPGIGHALFDECWHDRDGYGDEPPDLKAERAEMAEEAERAFENFIQMVSGGLSNVPENAEHRKKAKKSDEN